MKSSGALTALTMCSESYSLVLRTSTILMLLSAASLAANSAADTAYDAFNEDDAHSNSVASACGNRICGSAWQLAADSVAPGSLAAAAPSEDYAPTSPAAPSEDYAPTSPAGQSSIPHDAASIVQDAAAEGIEL